jgi:hypothetical protein
MWKLIENIGSIIQELITMAAAILILVTINLLLCLPFAAILILNDIARN